LLSAQFMALTLIEGRRNMPAFGGKSQGRIFYIVPTLDDEQIAAVTNYVRTHFGNHFKGTISAAQVKALRQTRTDAARTDERGEHVMPKPVRLSARS
jgi:mono/diheme cytochrome c family protein